MPLLFVMQAGFKPFSHYLAVSRWAQAHWW